MADLSEELRTAFESRGYDVGEVSVNRGRVRVALLERRAGADELVSTVHEVLDEGDVLGLNVSTEALDGGDAVGTVVSFRRRS